MKKIIFNLSLIITILSFDYKLVAQNLNHQKIDKINSFFDEQNPVVTPDGNKLFFTRSGHPENVAGVVDRGDIWWSEREPSGSWSEPKHLGFNINHVGLNGVVGFSSSGNTIYLLNYNDKNPSTGKGMLRSGLAKATWNGTDWNDPDKLNITFFSNRSEYINGYITPDENVMVLSIESYLTFGNEDLYVTFRQDDGSWTQPQNIGNTVNSNSEEWSPYLASDKKTLYFSSNGHGGFGSRDIFVSQRLDESWTNWSVPVNLGSDINTKGVELGYYIPIKGDEAFFSTTQNSEGFGDIFNAPLDKTEKALQNVQLVSMVVEPEQPVEETGPLVVAMTVQIIDINTEEPLRQGTAVFTYGTEESVMSLSDVTNPDKKFIVSFIEDTEVTVRIEAEGYLVYQEKFQAKATAQNLGSEFEITEDFRMTPDEVGTTVQIENILFTRATAEFSSLKAAQIELDKLLGLMNANSTMEIRLDGHTDNRGDKNLNIKLSEDRVKTVKAYLVEKGIDEARITAVGHGGAKPIARNSEAATRVLNRRVEFVITKN